MSAIEELLSLIPRLSKHWQVELVFASYASHADGKSKDAIYITFMGWEYGKFNPFQDLEYWSQDERMRYHVEADSVEEACLRAVDGIKSRLGELTRGSTP